MLNKLPMTFILTMGLVINAYGSTDYLKEISPLLKSKIKKVTNRQSGGTQRPEACPLESKLHIDLLNKVLNIKSLFNENCLDNDQTVLTEVLQGAETLQSELDQLNDANQGTEAEASEGEATTDEEIPTSTIELGGVEIDGQTVSDVLNNINSIYTKKSCSNLSDDQNFLSTTADIILDISKIGLLVPNTTVLAVAGGGVAVSSTLKILNSLFTKRFDFDETEDRQTFIKLNCAFYDIRRDIEKSGFLDVSTESHIDDLDITIELVNSIEKEHEEFMKSYETVIKAFEKTKKEFYQNQSGHLFELVEELETIEGQVNSVIEMPSQKLALIEIITRKSPIIQELLEAYISTSDDEMNFLNQQFMHALKMFDYTNIEGIIELQEMDPAEFVFKIQEIIKYHVSRLNENYDQMQKEIEKTWAKTPYLTHDGPEKFQEALEKERKKKSDEYEGLFFALNNTKDRLKRIVDEVPFTSNDDGTENVVSILSEFDSIVDQIYGKFGEKFLEYTTKKSIKLNNTFKENFSEFAKSHLDQKDGRFKVKEMAELTPLRLMFACQDARPFRRQWKLAESLAQQGYDFVATNADLFHSDINRVFLGTSGNRRGIHRILSKYEKIQMHHKSSIYAKKKISGIEFDEKYDKKYLRKKYLGRSILEITEAKKKAMILQKLIEEYDCPLQTIMP